MSRSFMRFKSLIGKTAITALITIPALIAIAFTVNTLSESLFSYLNKDEGSSSMKAPAAYQQPLELRGGSAENAFSSPRTESVDGTVPIGSYASTMPPVDYTTYPDTTYPDNNGWGLFFWNPDSAKAAATDDPEEEGDDDEPELTLIKTVKTANPMVNAKAGDKITWHFKVENTGTETVTGIWIHDSLLGNTTANSGKIPLGKTTLEPGDSVETDADYILVDSDITEGEVKNTATANGISNGKEIESEEDSFTVTFTPSSQPSLLLTKTAGNIVSNDDGTLSLTWTFAVKNARDVPLTDIWIYDEMLGSENKDSGKIKLGQTSLVAGGETTGSASYTLTEEDIAKGTLTNTAQAMGKEQNTAGEHINVVSNKATATVKVRDSKLVLEKTATPETIENAAVGTEVKWTFKVSNNGDSEISGIWIYDEMLGSESADSKAITLPSTTLAPGKDMTGTATYRLTEKDIQEGKVTNTALAKGKVSSATGLPTEVESNKADAEVTFSENKGLSLTKTVDKAKASVGDTLKYTITVMNTGDKELTDVKVKDELVNMIAYETVAEKLAPGEKKVIEKQYGPLTQSDMTKYKDTQKIVNTAYATATAPAGSAPVGVKKAEATTTLSSPTTLSLVKTAKVPLYSGDASKAGADITWVFTLTNNGTTTLSNIQISDPLLTSRNVQITGIPQTLEPGKSAEASAVMKATQQDIDAGSIVNTAKATASAGAQGGTVESAESTAKVSFERLPLLVVEKNADRIQARVGDVISYSVTVKNSGNVTLTSVKATDELVDVNLDPIAATLSPGESKEFVANYTVTQEDASAGTVVNIATASATPPAGMAALVPVMDDARTTIVGGEAPVASIKLTKSADQQTINPAKVGTPLTWIFSIENTGTVTLGDIQISDSDLEARADDDDEDDEDEIDISPELTLEPGKRVEFKATIRLTSEDISRGKVTNTATASAETPDGATVQSAPSTATVNLVTGGSSPSSPGNGNTTSNSSSSSGSVSKTGDGSLRDLCVFAIIASALTAGTWAYSRRRRNR